MKAILLTVFIFVLFASCKKEEKNAPSSPTCSTTVAKLTGSYKVTAMTYTAPGMPNTDYFATLNVCRKDDVHVLEANGNYSYQDAGAACAPPGSYSGTWSLSGNTLTLNTQVATIQSFNCDVLVIHGSPGVVAGDGMTTTLKKQ